VEGIDSAFIAKKAKHTSFYAIEYDFRMQARG
jgi:hypothetical protein